MMHRSPSLGGAGGIKPGGMPLPPAYSPAYTKPSAKRPAAIQADSWRLLVAISSSLLWMISSSALIIANKQLYDGPLPYPMMVTGLGQLASGLGALLLSVTGTMPLRSPPAPRFLVVTIGPVVIACAATMFFGNAAYLYLSLAFIQVLKAATPALTLLLGLFARVETVTLKLIFALGLIVGGTGAAVLLESGAPSFNWYGLLLFLISCFTEAARVVWSQVLLGRQNYNSAEVLLYVNAPAGVLLAAAGALVEGPKGMWVALANATLYNPRLLVLALTSSVVVNLSSYIAIAATGSLTFKVVGCIKNVGVVLYGAMVYGDNVSPLQWTSYAVSMLGFGLYTQAKAQAPPPKPRPSGTGAIIAKVGKVHST